MAVKYFYYLFCVDYVEEIYETFINAAKEKTLKPALTELDDMSPAPMNSMLNKESREEAILKRNQRKRMVVVDVLSTAIELGKYNSKQHLFTYTYILY